MKVAIVGATGSIGGAILQQTLLRLDITNIVAITRKPLPATYSLDKRVDNAVISDFGNLDAVADSTWSQIQDADALIWAMGTYNYNEDVNFKYPLAFQEQLAQRLINSRAREGKKRKFRFILLGGAFTETDQSRWLYFLGDQRRMKGLLQTETLALMDCNSEYWDAHVIRPAGILMGDNTYVNKIAEYALGGSLTIRGEELGAFVAGLAVIGSNRNVIENLEMVEIGRQLLAQTS